MFDKMLNAAAAVDNNQWSSTLQDVKRYAAVASDDEQHVANVIFNWTKKNCQN